MVARPESMTTPPRGPKLVILHRSATAYEAARAMKDNHVGAVLVADHGHLAGIVTDRDLALAIARADFDPHVTRLQSVMSDVVGTCDAGADVADIVTTMRQYACRRVPITREGRPVAVVTLDDLVLDGASLDDLRAIITAQLERPARLKPRGSLRPEPLRASTGAASLPDRKRAARAEAAYRGLVRDVERRVALPSPERAEAALALALGLLCRRLPAEEAGCLLAGLPFRVHAALMPEPEGPDESITIHTLAAELRREHDLQPDAAAEILLAIADSVHARTAEDAGPLRERLPAYLQQMFPRERLRRGHAH